MKICKCEKSDKKPRVNLTTEKNYIKKARMCFRWELNSRPFIRAEEKMEKKLLKKRSNLLSLEVELETFHNGIGG